MPEKKQNHLHSESRALTKMITSMIIFGTIGIFRRSIPLPSEVLAFARGIMGGVFLLIVLKVKEKKFTWNYINRTKVLVLILSGAMIGFNWILLFEAYKYTTVAIATLCYYMQPVIVICLAFPILKEKISPRQILCVILSVIGIALICGIFQGPVTGTSSKGVFLGLAAAGLYAGVVLMNKSLSGIPAFEKTIIQLFSAAAALLPYMAIQGTLGSYSLSVPSVICLVTTGIVHTGVAYVLYFSALEYLPARTSALLGYIDPVTAIFLSAVWLREPLTVFSVIGAVLIIGSALYSESE